MAHIFEFIYNITRDLIKLIQFEMIFERESSFKLYTFSSYFKFLLFFVCLLDQSETLREVYLLKICATNKMKPILFIFSF